MDAQLDKANDKLGMWSPITAHNDWCEENYDMTFYVAEFCEYFKSLNDKLTEIA